MPTNIFSQQISSDANICASRPHNYHEAPHHCKPLSLQPEQLLMGSGKLPDMRTPTIHPHLLVSRACRPPFQAAVCNARGGNITGSNSSNKLTPAATHPAPPPPDTPAPHLPAPWHPPGGVNSTQRYPPPQQAPFVLLPHFPNSPPPFCTQLRPQGPKSNLGPCSPKPGTSQVASTALNATPTSLHQAWHPPSAPPSASHMSCPHICPPPGYHRQH